MIVKCKSEKIEPQNKKDGVEQLKRYEAYKLEQQAINMVNDEVLLVT